ncbi:MAG: hypothetical protein HKN60_06590 [Rhizobiales bacterium]|nr:hypothetical protein [Hyphomicrobiales bacterium]
MTSAADRVREQLIHDLEELHEKRSQMQQFRPPIWQSLRFMGLVLIFIAALSWYTQTDWGLRVGVVGFIIGALMIMVPRGMGFTSILRWDGGLKVSNPQLDLKNLDERIETMQRTIEKMEAERNDEPDS